MMVGAYCTVHEYRTLLVWINYCKAGLAA